MNDTTLPDIAQTDAFRRLMEALVAFATEWLANDDSVNKRISIAEEEDRRAAELLRAAIVHRDRGIIGNADLRALGLDPRSLGLLDQGPSGVRGPSYY